MFIYTKYFDWNTGMHASGKCPSKIKKVQSHKSKFNNLSNLKKLSIPAYLCAFEICVRDHTRSVKMADIDTTSRQSAIHPFITICRPHVENVESEAHCNV